MQSQPVAPADQPDGIQQYSPTPATLAEIEQRFTYHAPKLGQADRYDQLRTKARELAYLIVVSTPVSREQSTALTKLEECIMHANAAIARRE